MTSLLAMNGPFSPGKDVVPFSEPIADLEALAEGIFAGPEAARGGFADDDNRHLPLGFARDEDATANDGNA